MATDDSGVRFQFGPPVRSSFLGGLRYTQFGFLLLGAGSAVLLVQVPGGEPGFFLALLAGITGVACAFGTVEGRPVDDWIPAGLRWLVVASTGRRRWTSPAPSAGERGRLDALGPLIVKSERVTTRDDDSPSPAIDEDPPSTSPASSDGDLITGETSLESLLKPKVIGEERAPHKRSLNLGRFFKGIKGGRSKPVPDSQPDEDLVDADPSINNESDVESDANPDGDPVLNGDGAADDVDDTDVVGCEAEPVLRAGLPSRPPKRRNGRRSDSSSRRVRKLAGRSAKARKSAQGDISISGGPVDDGEDSKRFRVRRAGKPSPPPPAADWQLVYASVSGHDMGVLRNRRQKTWLAAMAVQGQSFMLLDEAEQARRLSGWASIQASMARQGSPISRTQWLERTLPEAGDEMRSFFAERTEHTKGTQANDSYRELLAQAQPVTQQHETYLVVQISMAKAARGIRHAGGGDKGAVAVLYRELEHLQRRLRESDLNTNGFLSGDNLAMLVRTQFNPSDALAATARKALKSEIAVSARSAWPMATEVSWGSYRTDDVHHITYWVSEWPKLGVRPSFLSPLLLTSNGITRSVSVVSEPIPTAQAVRKVEHEQTARASDEELRSAAGYRTGARRRREAEALDRRENELADGHAENRFSGYVTVSGANLDEVEVAAAAIEQVAYQCPVELRRLWGEQDSAFYTTMPMARGLS